MSRRETLFWTLFFVFLHSIGFTAGWFMAKHFTQATVEPNWKTNKTLELDEMPLMMFEPLYMQGKQYWEPEAVYSWEGTVTDA